MKTAVKHCVSSAYQIGTGGGVEGRRGLAPPPIRLDNSGLAYTGVVGITTILRLTSETL